MTVRITVDDSRREALLDELGSDATLVGDDIELVVTNRSTFRSFLVGYLEYVEILEPKAIRDDMIAWLERIAQPEKSA